MVWPGGALGFLPLLPGFVVVGVDVGATVVGLPGGTVGEPVVCVVGVTGTTVGVGTAVGVPEGVVVGVPEGSVLGPLWASGVCDGFEPSV